MQGMQPQAQHMENAKPQAASAPNQAIAQYLASSATASPPTTAAAAVTTAIVLRGSSPIMTAAADSVPLSNPFVMAAASGHTQLQDIAVTCSEASDAEQWYQQQQLQYRQFYLQYSGYIAYLQQYQLYAQYQHQIHQADAQKVLPPGQLHPWPSMQHQPQAPLQAYTTLLPQQPPQQPHPPVQTPPGQHQPSYLQTQTQPLPQQPFQQPHLQAQISSGQHHPGPYVQYQPQATPQTHTQPSPHQPPELHVPAQLPQQVIPSTETVSSPPKLHVPAQLPQQMIYSTETVSSNQQSHVVIGYPHPQPTPATPQQHPVQSHPHQAGMPLLPQHPQTQGQYPPQLPPHMHPSDAHMDMRVYEQPPLAPSWWPTTNLHLGQQKVQQSTHQSGMQALASQHDCPHPQVQGNLYSGQMQEGPLPSTQQIHPQQPLRANEPIYIHQHVPGQPFLQALAARQAQASPIVPNQGMPQQPFQQHLGGGTKPMQPGQVPNQIYLGRSNPCVATSSELQQSQVSLSGSQGTMVPEPHMPLPNALYGQPNAVKTNEIPKNAGFGGMHNSDCVHGMTEGFSAPHDETTRGSKSEFKEGDEITTSKPLSLYQSGTPFPPSSGGSIVDGPDIPNIISHTGGAQGYVLSSNIRGSKAAGFGGFHSHPGISEHGGSGNLHSHIRFGDSGFNGHFNSVSLRGDAGSIEQLKNKKPVSMGWCLLCKIDCKTVEGLNLHSSTMEHDKMAMDLVQGIKQDSAKKHKLPMPFEVARNSKKANFENRGKRLKRE